MTSVCLLETLVFSCTSHLHNPCDLKVSVYRQRNKKIKKNDWNPQTLGFYFTELWTSSLRSAEINDAVRTRATDSGRARCRTLEMIFFVQDQTFSVDTLLYVNLMSSISSGRSFGLLESALLFRWNSRTFLTDGIKVNDFFDSSCNGVVCVGCVW